MIHISAVLYLDSDEHEIPGKFDPIPVAVECYKTQKRSYLCFEASVHSINFYCHFGLNLRLVCFKWLIHHSLTFGVPTPCLHNIEPHPFPLNLSESILL